MSQVPGFRGLLTVLATALVVAGGPVAAEPSSSEQKLTGKVKSAREVYRELLEAPDRSVPSALLERCKCVAVIPHAIKGAFGYGARFGQGVISCRDSASRWSPLSFLKLTGGSVGFQIGAEASDYVLFFMTEVSARSLLASKFTLGGTASVAAGPVGRSAEASTDIRFDAEIYTYAKSKGLFAGVSLEGARLAPDGKANQTFYGVAVEPAALLLRHEAPRMPPEAEDFLRALPIVPKTP